jgi:CHAD domain-containing protein
VARYGKWAQGFGPDDSVGVAAKRTLQRRFAAVIAYLELAARCAKQSPEYVHQLRVQSRRASAALELYRDVLRNKPRKWLRRTLRAARKAAGDARDLDVLAENLDADPSAAPPTFREGLRQRRVVAQQPIVALDDRLNRGKKLRKKLHRLLDVTGRKRSAIAESRFGEWAVPQLRRAVKPFLESASTHVTDLTSLHALRILTKKVRYAMELLAPAFPDSFRQELYPVVAELQERLGKIHDQALARNRLMEWIASGTWDADVRTKRKLIARECQRLSDLRRDYQASWTPALQKSLRLAFQALWRRSEDDAGREPEILEATPVISR